MNKETLQEYNTRLAENNTSLDDVLNAVNNLPERGTGGGGSSNVYSLEETVIGTWINGKPLYRKVVFISEIGNAGNLEVPYNIPDVELIWVDETAAFAFASYETIPASSTYGGDLWIRAWTNMNLKVIRLRTPANLTGYSAYITLAYTKTTD